MDSITLTIDNQEITATKGMSILQAAQSAGIYIPSLCSHPDLPPKAFQAFKVIGLRPPVHVQPLS